MQCDTIGWDLQARKDSLSVLLYKNTKTITEHYNAATTNSEAFLINYQKIEQPLSCPLTSANHKRWAEVKVEAGTRLWDVEGTIALRK